MKMSKFLILLIILLIISAVVTISGPVATAQGDPTPSVDIAAREDVEAFYQTPSSSTGNAVWTVTDPHFESRYPDGFFFSINANSSDGEIVAATAVFSHVPGRQMRQAAVYTEDTGLWQANWKPDRSLPPWVAVNYFWLFTDASGNTFRSQWYLDQEYADNTREWSRVEGEDLIIFIQEGLGGDVADQAIEAMAAQRETFRQAWGGLLSYKPRAILFADLETFNEWRLNFTPRSDIVVIGQTSGDWGATIQVVFGGSIVDLAWGTVLHEVAHLYQDEFLPAAGFIGGTGWWSEGQATFFELNQQYNYEARVRSLAEDGLLEPLLPGFGPNPGGSGPDNRTRYGYDVGYTFFAWLVDRYGLDGHRQVIDLLDEGYTRDDALAEVTGLTPEEIETAWRLWLGASAEAPTLIPTPTIEMRFPPTVTPHTFAN